MRSELIVRQLLSIKEDLETWISMYKEQGKDCTGWKRQLQEVNESIEFMKDKNF